MAARKVLIRFPVLALGVGFMASVACGLVVLLGGLVLAVVRPPVAHAATFTVDSTVDAVDAAPGDGVCATAGGTCTLRAAVQEANALGGANTIEVPAGTHTLTLAGVEDAAASGDLDVTGGSLTIEGATAATTVVDANGLDRIFEVLAPATASIANLTMKNGRSPATISYPITGSGGGIFNHGTLTLTNSSLTGNSAVAGQLGIGGGIENDGTLTLVNSAVSGNSAVGADGAVGGGIANFGTAMLTDSTVDSNSVTYLGGGIFSSSGTMTLLRCTVSRNAGDTGGGIFNLNGSLTLTNSTVSGNDARYAGGIANKVNSSLAMASLTLNNVTIADNHAAPMFGFGGGGLLTGFGPLTVVEIGNSILAGNTDASGRAPDCFGALSSQGYNLIQSTKGCFVADDTTGNLTGLAAKLRRLADNGGPTQTQALLPGSPALDAGNPAPPGTGGNACEATDQRGVTRPQGWACDIGAYERRSGARP